MSNAVAIRAILETRTLRITGLAGIELLGAGLCALAFLYFDWWMGVWLVTLAILAHSSPGWGLGLLFLSVSMDSARPVVEQIIVSYSELQIAVFLLSWFGGSLWREKKLIHDWRLLRWSAPFLLIILVSGVLSSSILRAAANSLRFAEMFILAFLTANALRDGSSSAPRFRWFLLLAALFYSIVGALQFPVAPLGRIYSTFTNPNQFAGYLNLLLPFAVLLLFWSRNGERTLWGYSCIILLLASAATLSRAGFLAGLCSVATVVALYLRPQSRHDLWQAIKKLPSHSRPLLPHALLGIALAAALSLAPPVQRAVRESIGNIMARSRSGFVSSFQEVRQPFFEVGWAIWKENFWLGVGPGNYRRALEEKRELIRSYRRRLEAPRVFVRSMGSHVHNLYLQTCVNFGVLGLAAFLYFFLRVLRALLRDARGSPAAIAGVSLLAAFLLHNLLDVTFPSLGIEMGILLGVSFNNDRL